MTYRPSNYNFPDAIRGDSFSGILFTVKVNDVPIDLTSANIEMDLKLTPTGAVIKHFEVGDGFTIDSDPTTGKFTFDEWLVDVPPETYTYDIEITFANTEVRTYIGGAWEIVQDVTNSI